jgi:CRISPR/Cas system Type II protein with McrA/HNH and RuvC-like nuclease domain
MKDLELAFDVGHRSISWAVLQTNPSLEIKGCGVVIFRADDCLASKRRDYRRQRRLRPVPETQAFRA